MCGMYTIDGDDDENTRINGSGEYMVRIRIC